MEEVICETSTLLGARLQRAGCGVPSTGWRSVAAMAIFALCPSPASTKARLIRVAALLIVEAGLAKSLGLQPIAFIGPSAAAGVDPAFMGLGPVPAIRKALLRAKLTLDRIDLFELNEAFAAQVLACQRDLGIDNAKLNVNGGAIAIGHPLGCSGARLATTLIHQMARTGASRGIASLCVGVGQGLATVFERE